MTKGVKMSIRKLYLKSMGELFRVKKVGSVDEANELMEMSNLLVIDNNSDFSECYLATKESLRPTEEPEELIFIKELSNGNLYTDRFDLTSDELRELSGDSMMVDFEALGVLVFNEWLFSENGTRREECKNIIKQMLPDARITGDWKTDIYAEVQKKYRT